MERDQDSSAVVQISDLPDSLLTDIISMASLKTRAAVQMCVFSKRWKNVWVSLTDLNFNLYEFDNGDPSRDHTRFSNFVDRVIAGRRKINLRKFELWCSKLEDDNHSSSIRQWMEYAIEHHVQILKIGASKCNVLPQSVFTCGTLVKLVLDFNDWGDLRDNFPIGTINLPKIQKLKLISHVLTPIDGNIFSNLILGCPNLLEFYRERLWVQHTSSSEHVIAPKNLKIVTEIDSSGNFIEVPNLVSYSFFGHIMGIEFVMKFHEKSSLTHARVHLYDDGSCDITCRLANFLWDLSFHVENLELCLDIYQSPWYYTTMPKLKNLSYCVHHSEYLSGIWDHLPNLENLTLWHCCQYDRYKLNYQFGSWEDTIQEALQKCKNLKELEIKFSRHYQFGTWKDTMHEALAKCKNPKEVEIKFSLHVEKFNPDVSISRHQILRVKNPKDKNSRSSSSEQESSRHVGKNILKVKDQGDELENPKTRKSKGEMTRQETSRRNNLKRSNPKGENLSTRKDSKKTEPKAVTRLNKPMLEVGECSRTNDDSRRVIEEESKEDEPEVFGKTLELEVLEKLKRKSKSKEKMYRDEMYSDTKRERNSGRRKAKDNCRLR